MYCYEKFKIGTMKPDVIIGVKNLIGSRINDISSLSINWFGGEPMVAYRQIIDIMEHVNRIKNQVSFNSEMTTNGYLLNGEKFARLVELGISKYQIAFDGDKEEHDKLRVKIDGNPTFDAIWKNVIAAKNTDLDFRVLIRLHVNKDNEQSMMRFLRRVDTEIGKDKRFGFYIRQLSRLGGENDEHLPIIEDGKSTERLIQSAKSIGFSANGHAEDYVCYAAKPNEYIIRADGSISKCTVALYDDNNRIGKLNKDGTMDLDSNKISQWCRGLFSGDKNELACPLRNFPITTKQKVYA